MKALFFFIALWGSAISFGQTYFHEDFKYESYQELDSLFDNRVRKNFWTTHFSENIDISENGVIDSLERIKKTSIVADPYDATNKIIRFELHKANPKFYAKHSCDDIFNNNVFPDSTLDAVYVKEKDVYCYDCASSPLQTNFSRYRNHMNRNEIAVYGPDRKLYKSNRTYWFGVKTLVDEKHELDSIRNGEIITQFHLSDKTGNPPVAMSIVNGHYKLIVIKNNDGKGDVYDLGKVEKGVWVEWMYHLNISNKDKKGFIELWKNGEKVVSVSGKNVYKNARYYLKIGIYKWGWWDCKSPYNYSKTKIVSYDKVWATKKHPSIVPYFN